MLKNGRIERARSKAKYEVKLEQYVMKILIEAGVLGDLTMNHVVPVALKYQRELVQVIGGLTIFMKDYGYARELCCVG